MNYNTSWLNNNVCINDLTVKLCNNVPLYYIYIMKRLDFSVFLSFQMVTVSDSFCDLEKDGRPDQS